MSLNYYTDQMLITKQKKKSCLEITPLPGSIDEFVWGRVPNLRESNLFKNTVHKKSLHHTIRTKKKKKKVKNDEGPGTVPQLSVDLPIVLCDNSAHHVEDDLEVTNQYESFEQFIVICFKERNWLIVLGYESLPCMFCFYLKLNTLEGCLLVESNVGIPFEGIVSSGETCCCFVPQLSVSDMICFLLPAIIHCDVSVVAASIVRKLIRRTRPLVQYTLHNVCLIRRHLLGCQEEVSVIMIMMMINLKLSFQLMRCRTTWRKGFFRVSARAGIGW